MQICLPLKRGWAAEIYFLDGLFRLSPVTVPVTVVLEGNRVYAWQAQAYFCVSVASEGEVCQSFSSNKRSQIRQENPLNLSILISGGRETN